MSETGVADAIRRGMGDCSPAERKVARVLLAAYPSAGFETVARLAERSGVSGPTVIRFVNRLGYKGFPDFQEALRNDLDERSASPLRIYETRRSSDAAADASLVERSATIAVDTLQRTFDGLTPHDVERCIELLAEAPGAVHIAGGRYSQLLGRVLALHLQQLRPRVAMLPDELSSRAAVVEDIGRRDVLVLFDYRRYEDESLPARSARAGPPRLGGAVHRRVALARLGGGGGGAHERDGRPVAFRRTHPGDGARRDGRRRMLRGPRRCGHRTHGTGGSHRHRARPVLNRPESS